LLQFFIIMESALSYITDLKTKVLLLLSRYNDIKKENNRLRNDKIELMKRMGELDLEIKELKKRVEIVDVSQGISSKDSKSVDVARLRVNNLIRDIDKCITLLND